MGDSTAGIIARRPSHILVLAVAVMVSLLMSCGRSKHPDTVGAGRQPAGEGQGAPTPVPGDTAAPPAGSTDAAVVAGIERRRGAQTFAEFWKQLLLHGTAEPSSTYLYLNDRTKTDLPGDTRSRASDYAVALVREMELRSVPRPVLWDFYGVATQVQRPGRVTDIRLLAANAAKATRDTALVEAIVVYEPHYADGTAGSLLRLDLFLRPTNDGTLVVEDAYFF